MNEEIQLMLDRGLEQPYIPKTQSFFVRGGIFFSLGIITIACRVARFDIFSLEIVTIACRVARSLKLKKV